MKKKILIQKIAFFIMVTMNVFCVLSSHDRLLENHKHDRKMAAISPENYMIHSSKKVKQRSFTTYSTFASSTESHFQMSEKKKLKNQNAKSYSPTKKDDVQSVYKNSMKQTHFSKANI